MNCYATIPVLSLLHTSIYSRDAVNILLREVEDNHCDYIDIDFSGIEFISRSFADEFHIQKLELAANTNKTIIVHNASPDVLKMLQSVAKTQTSSRPTSESIPLLKFSDSAKLTSFFLSI